MRHLSLALVAGLLIFTGCDKTKKNGTVMQNQDVSLTKQEEVAITPEPEVVPKKTLIEDTEGPPALNDQPLIIEREIIYVQEEEAPPEVDHRTYNEKQGLSPKEYQENESGHTYNELQGSGYSD